MFHIAVCYFERCRRVMPHRGIEVGLLRSPTRFAFELGDVRTIDPAIVYRGALDRIAVSAADRLRCRRGDVQVRGIGSRRAGHRHCAFLNMINNGFRQAQFPGGGQILYLVALFHRAQSDDAPAVLPATEQSPHELYDAIKALRIDPTNVYRITPGNHIQLRRGDAVLSFEEGTVAFFSPLDGQITGAVFSGRGHVLAAPRDPVEKQQMGRFLGVPVLDQEFINGYLRFTDETAAELVRQFRAANLVAQTDTSVSAQWDSAVSQLNPSYTLRILFEWLSPNPKPCFHAGLEGAATGPFDVVLDAQRDEQFLLGQLHSVNGKSFYDVWTSHRVPDSPVLPAAFRALHYSLETTISSNNSLDATATVRLRAETGTERVLAFQLSRALTLDSVTGEQGEILAFFQNEGMNLQERSARGNDYLDVVLPQTPARNLEFTLHFHYRGNVIQDAGNGVLFVGARESWYPHLGDSGEFSSYDFLLRWPRKLRLIATGSKLDEHEEGEFRVGHWKAEKPISVAGFNLGEYASASVASGAHSVDVYANRELEEDLRRRLSSQVADALAI